MNDLIERIRHYASGISLGDRVTQLTAASLVLLMAISVTVFRDTSTEPVEGLSSEVGDEAAEASASPTFGPGDTAIPGRTAGRVAGPSAPVGGGDADGLPDFGSNAPGVTDDEILVGAAYDRNAGGLNAAFGFAGIGQIDPRAAFENLRDHINRNGGIAGRKIRLIFHEFDSLAGQTEEAIAQQACNTWTQDNRVFMALAGAPPALNECLKQAGVAQIGGGGGLADSKTYRDFPYLVSPGSPALDRMARFYVDQLHARGYYSRGRNDQPKLPRKVGVVGWDEPVFDRAIDAFRKALDAHGIPLAEVAQVKRFQSEAEITESIAGIQSAVLRFKANNVTHVQFLSTSNAFQQFTFWASADQQQYYPRYGLTSTDAGQALIPTLENAQGSGSAARTFRDSLSVGWFPLFDVPRSDYSGDKETPALRQCKQILSYESFDDPSRNKEALAASVCDLYFYMKAALDKVGPVINLDSWLHGVANVGSVSSAATFDMKTTADRHDGMSTVRDLQYFENCNCFHYTSGNKPV